MAKEEVVGSLASNSIILSDYAACLLVQVAERFAGNYGDVWQSLISKMITKGFVNKDGPRLPVHFHSKSQSIGGLIITAAKLPEEKIKTLAELSKLFIGNSGVEWVNYISDVILKGLIYNWELDRFGRIIIPVVGKGLTGQQWINSLKERGYDVDTELEFTLLLPDYNVSHRLEAGRIHRVAMIFGDSITDERDRRNCSIRDIAKRAYGKKAAGDTKLELIFLLRDLFTDDELSSIGIDYVSAARTIETNDEAWKRYRRPPNIISFSRRNFPEKPFNAFYYSGADSTWNEKGAFPFIVG